MKIKNPKKINKKENILLEKLYHKYFKKNKKSEANLNIEKINKILKKFPKSETLIIDNKKIVGEITIIPTNKKIMKKFIENKITEKEMILETIKKISLKNFNCIYLCYFVLDKKYRKKGIITKSIYNMLEYYIKLKNKITLFIWPFSKEGEKIAKNISNKYNLTLIIKK